MTTTPGLTVHGTIEELARDWELLYTFVSAEALATHYADGTPLAPQQRVYAQTVLDMLKCRKQETA